MAWLSGLLLVFLAQNGIACKDGEVQFTLATYSTCQGGQFAFTGCTQMLNNGTDVRIPIGQAIQEPGNKKLSCFIPPETKGVPLANEIACTDDDNNLIQPGEKKVLPDGTILICTQISQYTLRREIFTPGKSPTSSIVDNVYFAVDSKGNKVAKGCAPYNNETTISVGENAVVRRVHYSCSADNGQIIFKPDSCISQDGKKMEISAKQQLADGSSESCVADGAKVVYFAATKNGCRLNNGKYVRINAIHQEEKTLLEDGKPFKYYVNYRCTQNSAILALTPVGCDVGQEGSTAYGEMVTIGQKTYSCELAKTDEIYVESINAQDASCKVGGKTYLHGEELFDNLNTTIYRCDKGNLVKTGCWAKGKRFIIGETFYCADHGYYCPVAGTGPVYLGEGCQVDGKLIHFKIPYNFTDGQYICSYKITEIGVRPYWAPQACAYKNGLLDLGSYSFDNLSKKYYFCGFSYKNRTLYVSELTTEESDCARAAGGFSFRCATPELPPKGVEITVPTEETPKGQPLIPGIQEEITKASLGNAEGTTKTPVGPNGPSPSGPGVTTDSPNGPPGSGGFTGPNLPGATTGPPSGPPSSPNGSNSPGGSTVSSNKPNSFGSPNRPASPGPSGPITPNVPGSPTGSPNGVLTKSPAEPTDPNQTSGSGGITSLPNKSGASTGSPDGLNPPDPNGAQTGLPNASGATTKSPNGPASGPGVSTVSSNGSNGSPGASTTVSINEPNPPDPNGHPGSPNAPGASTKSSNGSGVPSEPGSPTGSPTGPYPPGVTTKSPSFVSGSPSGPSSSGPGVPTAFSNGPNLPGAPAGSPNGPRVVTNAPNVPGGPTNSSNGPGSPTGSPNGPGASTKSPNGPGASTVSQNGPNGAQTGLPNASAASTKSSNGPGVPTGSPNGVPTKYPAGLTGPNQTSRPGGITSLPNQPGASTGSPDGLNPPDPNGAQTGLPNASGATTKYSNGPAPEPDVFTISSNRPGSPTGSPGPNGSRTSTSNGPNPPGPETKSPNVPSPSVPGASTDSPNGSEGFTVSPNPSEPGAPTGPSNEPSPPGVATKTPIGGSTVPSNGPNPPGPNGPGTPGTSGVSTKSPNVSGPSISGSNTGSPDGSHPPAGPTSSPNGPTVPGMPGVPTQLPEKDIVTGKYGPTPPAGSFTVKPVSPSANNGGTTKSPQPGVVTENGPTKSSNAPGEHTDSPNGATRSPNQLGRSTQTPNVPTTFTLGAATTAAMTPKPGPTLVPKTRECCIFENDKLCHDVCKMLAPHCVETMLTGIKKALPPNSDSIYMLLKYFNRNAQTIVNNLSNLAKMFNITSLVEYQFVYKKYFQPSRQLSLRISDYIQIVTRDRIAESADCQLYLSSCIHGNINNCNKLSSPKCQVSYKCPNSAPGCLRCQDSRSSRVDMQHLVKYLCPGTCFVSDKYQSADIELIILATAGRLGSPGLASCNPYILAGDDEGSYISLSHRPPNSIRAMRPT